MKYTFVLLVAAAVAATATMPVDAQIIVDFQATCGGAVSGACTVGTTYAGVGLTFTPNTQQVCMGISNGDPGGWGLEGTNSAKFLCFNGGNPGYAMDLALATPTNSFKLDVSRSSGSSAGDSFTINALNGGTLLTTQTITLGPINSWTTVTLSASGINHVTWTSNGSGFHPYGVDNIVIASAPIAPIAPIPTQSPWTMGVVALLIATFGFFALRRR